MSPRKLERFGRGWGGITGLQVDIEDLENELDALRRHEHDMQFAWEQGVTVPRYHQEMDHLRQEHSRIVKELQQLRAKLEKRIDEYTKENPMRPKTGDYIRVEEVDELGRWRTIGEGVVKKPNRKKPRTITIVDVLGEDFRFPYPHPRYRVTDRPQPRVQRPGSGGRTGGDRKISAQKARALMDSAGLRGRALPRIGYLVKLDDEMSQWIDNRSGQYFHVVWGDLIKPDWVGNPLDDETTHQYGEVIQSFGDVDFVEYGGQLLVRDENGGLYLEAIEEPEEGEAEEWTIYRTDIDQLKKVPKGGKVFLVSSSYRSDWSHPVSSYDEWFSKHIDEVADTSGMDSKKLVKMFCSDDPVDRAEAYITLASHFGWYELDQYPLRLSRKEVEERYGE
jgi:uncharacterized protein YukE